MKKYLYSVNDAVTEILGRLDDLEYDKLNDDEFEKLERELVAFGEQFVFIDSINVLSLAQDEYTKNTLQIVSFVHPKQYLCINFGEHGLECSTVNSKQEVLEQLHQFINNVEVITFEQADTINEIIEFYS